MFFGVVQPGGWVFAGLPGGQLQSEEDAARTGAGGGDIDPGGHAGAYVRTAAWGAVRVGGESVLSPLTSAAEAGFDLTPVIAAVNRCATQNQVHHPESSSHRLDASLLLPLINSLNMLHHLF